MDVQTAPLILSGQQLALYEALRNQNIELAVMYQGAIKVLIDMNNSDRFALAAHNMRELMEKLPYYIDVETKAHNQTLGSKVQLLKERWNEAFSKTNCLYDGMWCGEVDEPLASLLRDFGSFFKWHDENLPKRNEEVKTALRELDVSGYNLPQSLEEQNVKTWNRLREYFLKIAHHRARPKSQGDFNYMLDAFEVFLLDRLNPRTYADLDAIDEILQEGDNGA